MKRNCHKRQKGSMIALLAIALPVLIGGAGLVLDTGALYDLRRQTQAAADAAAIAGAQELRLQNFSAIKGAALYDAEENGFINAGSTSVHVNRPPARGRYAGNDKFVEVTVRGEAPSFFMQALTNRTFPVEGRAVAGVAANNTCMWTLDKSSKQSLDITGKGRLHFKDCGVYVASKHSNAARTAGGGTLSASSIDIVGGFSGGGFTPKPATGASDLDDPFAELASPSATGCNFKNTKVKATTTLTPGVYCGGITVNAKGKAKLKPGVYVLKGTGLTVNGKGSIEGEEVTFFNTADRGYKMGVIKLNGGAKVSLSAPTLGSTKGMLFFDDRTQAAKTHTFNGGATVDLNGALYFPNSTLKLAGNFDGTGGSIIIAAKKLSISGKASFRKPAVSSLPPVLAVARVVE